MTCAAPTMCWAVGFYNNGTADQTLAEQWNGTSWAIVGSPNNSTTQLNHLDGVTCSAASTCWAVGFSSVNSHNQTLVEQWDGTSWAIVPSPNTSATQDNQALGVTCPTASECWAIGYYYNDSGYGQTLVENYSLTNPPSWNVASRMTQGNAGTFDINLPLTGNPGIECRSAAANYSVVFSFINNITNCGSAATAGGSVVAGPNGNQCTENLTGLANAQYINIGLNNVVDSQDNTGNVSVAMGLLIGDVNGTGVVDGNDVSEVQAHTRQPVNGTNFRYDVNATGNIDGNDVSLTQSHTRTSLPPYP